MAKIDDQINQILQNNGMSIKNHSLVDSYRSLNIIGRNANIPVNRENHGYTFFTRPALNLSDANILNDRGLSMLMSEGSDSISRAIRCMLDYQLSARQDLHSDVIDQYNPFMPILSNNLISLTGWRDYTTQTTSTPSGIYRESMSLVDDTPYDYEEYDLTANFRNITGDPITSIAYIWTRYMKLLKIGAIMSYPDFIALNEMEYFTRIYRIVTDVSRQKVLRVVTSGASFPINAPIGDIMNFAGDGNETPFTTAENQIAINFRCTGTIYQDWKSIYDFNWLVQTFNRNMRDDYRSNNMVKLRPEELALFSRSIKVYPLIDVGTMDLNWFVYKETYQAMVEFLVNNAKTSSSIQDAQAKAEQFFNNTRNR